jgi:hypothetical protein
MEKQLITLELTQEEARGLLNCLMSTSASGKDLDVGEIIEDKLWGYLKPLESKEQVKCYDKFNQLLKEGDYVDVQKDGVHQIYKKDDGQLYFNPYGKEDRVSSYFSNDIAKCDANGNWLNNDRYEDIPETLE